MYQMIQKCTVWRVFSEFAKNPGKPYHVRELSRKMRLAHTSVNIHLKELERNRMVKKEKVGIYYAYKSNFGNDNFRFYKKIMNIINLKESGLIEDLENKATPDAIILFGSYAKGEDMEKSDIDIFMAAREKRIDLMKYENKLHRKIQLFFSEDIAKFPKELQNNILNGIILSGFLRWKI